MDKAKAVKYAAAMRENAGIVLEYGDAAVKKLKISIKECKIEDDNAEDLMVKEAIEDACDDWSALKMRLVSMYNEAGVALDPDFAKFSLS